MIKNTEAVIKIVRAGSKLHARITPICQCCGEASQKTYLELRRSDRSSDVWLVSYHNSDKTQWNVDDIHAQNMEEALTVLCKNYNIKPVKE